MPRKNRLLPRIGRLALSLCLTALLAPLGQLGLPAAHAQFINNAPVSSQGTQFVRPPPQVDAPQVPEPVSPVPTPVPAPTPVPQPKLQVKEAPPPHFPTVVFLLDTSDSMLERSTADGPTRLEEARQALTAVLEGMQPEARVQIRSFNTRMSELRVPGVRAGEFLRIGDTQGRAALVGRLQALRTAGCTNLYKATLKALDIFSNPADQADFSSGRRFPVLVVVSDGQDSGKTREVLDTVLAAKARSPLVTINAIGFRAGPHDGWFEDLCRIATRPTGCAPADNAKDLQRLLGSFHRYSE